MTAATQPGFRPQGVLLVLRPGARNIRAAERAAEILRDAGIRQRRLVCSGAEAEVARQPILRTLEEVDYGSAATDAMELVLVLGGDGTFLRAAHLAHSADLPVLGINLGHVGFLAEWEAESLEEAVSRVIAGDFRIEDRMTIDCRIFDREMRLLGGDFALNDVSVENINRRGVLDASLEVDGRPVSSFGCDGVLVATPTGSTAYSFSAGGPVLWPELEAILVVPNNAHALFTKPLVTSPRSTVAVETAAGTTAAQAVFDGFHILPMPPGSRIEVTRGHRSVRWVRLDDSPFADRLVTKLRLPVEGWRGRA